LAIQLLVKGKNIPSVKRNPRPHQQEAIAASKQYFLNDKNTRGKLIMPCGTGKSLTAYWISQALSSKTTIIALPSLILLNKTLEDWTKEITDSNHKLYPEWCCICSDETAGKLNDDLVSDIFSSGIPTTTNDDEITSFLKRKAPGGKIIFTTYQSADKLAQVSRRIKFKFDLAILDEAHKTVGTKDKAFSILLQENKINISKRLFMTATERILKGAEDEILSMDDDKVYGNVFYNLSFKKAIENGIITDYKIVTVLVNDTEIQDLIKKNKYVSDYGKKFDEAEVQMLTTAIALKKALKEYNINHTVSFHKSINSSKEFQSLYQKIDTGKDRPTVFHISSKLNAGARAELLRDFRNTSNAIITNARCLTEGVDVPAIDCVLFADQKQSVVDIVQASGRALRQYTDKNTGIKKNFGYIIIPVVLKEGEGLDDLTESSRFKTLTRIVTSLSTQDETIAEELKLISSGKQKTGSGKIQVIGSINKSFKVDLKKFTLTISTKIWERVARINPRDFNEARSYIRKLGIKNSKEWFGYCISGDKPFDIPSHPRVTYRNSGWISFQDWVGSKWAQWVSYEEASSFAKKLNLTSTMWKNEYSKSNDRPKNIPANPDIKYRNKGWISWTDFLGTNYHKYDSFIDARKYTHSLGLSTKNEWYDYWKSKKRPANIPSNPSSTYKKSGWISWSDWLGNEWAPFDKAKKFSISLKLKSPYAWKMKFKELNKDNKIPKNIPSRPEVTYKNKGWISWQDWLGL
jgi:superfamily II DNA or RNA helicase